MGSKRFVWFYGQFHAHFGSLAGAAAKMEDGPHFFRPLAHPQQAEMPAGGRSRRRGIEAHTIIFHAKHELVGLEGQRHLDASGAAVCEGVGHGLLDNSQEVQFHNAAGAAADPRFGPRHGRACRHPQAHPLRS